MSGLPSCSGQWRSPAGRGWRAGLRAAVLASVLSFSVITGATGAARAAGAAGASGTAGAVGATGAAAAAEATRIAGGPDRPASPAPAKAPDPDHADCPPPAGRPLPRGALPRAARALRDRRALRIVALGSSSTAGAGASSVGTTYPSRLAVELLRRLPGHRIEVINAGINGQEAPDMLTRLQRDVFDRRPDLLIWQAGSNALLRRVPVDVVERALMEGIRGSHEHGVDVLLMDLQFAPRVNDMPERDRMLAMFGRVTMATGAPVFARFDLMRGWSQMLGSRFPQMLLDDGLHLNDRSYECLARRLAQVLVDAIRPARGADDGIARSR